MAYLEVKDLVKTFKVRTGPFSSKELNAVRQVSFSLEKGMTLGVVGESGSGKSTLGRAILRLVEANSGDIVIDGAHINQLSKQELRAFRKKAQMVFQDPYSSLNPRQTVGEILEEPIQIHRLVNGPQETKKEIERVLNRVGLPADSVSRYPHEFSGGQRQRIGLARALMVRPDLLICDEPVSALDVSIQAQIINLLEDLKRDLNLTVVFISHDLRVVYQMSDFVAVMYLGRIVEYGPSEEVFSAPQHPYTQVLLSSVPHIRKGNEARIKLKGEPPNALTPPSGCTFHPRCPKSRPSCQMEVPNLEQRGLRRVACPITD